MNATLTAAVAHDVKNRMAILADELARLSALSLDDTARGHVASANEQATQLCARLTEWLTVQRAEAAGGLRATPREEWPEIFLDGILDQASALAQGRIALVKEVAEDVPEWWFFDAHLVRLALDSALHNALRFARTRIALGARREGSMLCLYVHDDGPGVQSVPCATSTGLGRTLCEQVAQAHRNRGLPGQARLGDHARGGAVFELLLP